MASALFSLLQNRSVIKNSWPKAAQELCENIEIIVQTSTLPGKDARKDVRFTLCPNNCRSEAALLPIIQRYVAPGTLILTDKWAGYRNLSSSGLYFHSTVNHSQNFVDPVTGAHTQGIEGTWRDLKAKVNRGQTSSQYLGNRISEYVWRRQCRRDRQDPFLNFISIVKQFK